MSSLHGLQELLEQGLLLACALQLPPDGGALGNLLATYAAVLAGQVSFPGNLIMIFISLSPKQR